MKKNLRIIATLVAKPASADEVRALLVPAVDAFRAEPGCEGYILHADRKHPGRFITYEAWADEKSLAAHMAAPTMKSLGPVLAKMLDGEIEQDFLTALVEL